VKPRFLVCALILVVAAGLRFPRLADRPMHADEAVLADKLGTLIETGGWQYDPQDYHGPVLPYLTAIPAWIAGVHRYRDLTEPMLRAVPALFGLLLVMMPLLLSRWMGWAQAVVASALTSVSPAMVYYSRYYIPEMLLTYLTAGLIVAWWRYLCTGSMGWALSAGLLSGLMFACKETAIIAIGCIALATGITARKRLPDWRHVLLGLAVAVAVMLGLMGGLATLQGVAAGLRRATQAQQHAHPWYYYLRVLLFSPGPGGFSWSEGLILTLAAVGSAAAFTKRLRPGADRGLVRLLCVYTLSMTACYSLIPYKTPWCLLGFLYGMILLAGVGVAVLIRLRSRAVRASALVLAAVCSVHLLAQAVLASQVYPSDPRNPYAYAHTTADVYALRDRLEGLAAADPQGREMRVQVLSRENVWPLPWYLRFFPHVEWWRAVGDQMQPASVIIASPDMESALASRLYEVPPPGQRALYVSMFRREIDLRPGVELRGYVKQSLWEAYLRRRGSREDGFDR
jgi:predicted membrane-bound mannosyltransferase